MFKFFLIFFLSINISNYVSQVKFTSIEGEWLVKDLDNSIVNFYKGSDGIWYSRILSSNNPVYINQVIYKGNFVKDNSYLEGTFITPKSKMNIITKVYKDNEELIRFVGKKFFITKTYRANRIK